MKLPKYLSRSIGMTQAVAVLLASLIISVTLSGMQLGYNFQKQRQAAIELSEEILTIAEGGATTASWTLDTGLANEVIHSIIALRDVQAAVLLDENGCVLAQAERPESDYDTLTSWFARAVIGDSIRGQRDLSVEVGGGTQRVGSFSIVLSAEHVADQFLLVATPLLISGLVQALAISLMLLWLSARLVTSHLQRAALTIARIDPQNPDATEVDIPEAHKDNELGYLLGHTNKMVARLGHVQEQLKQLASHDPLTELPNRSSVVSRLESAVARARRNNTRVAVVFLDLDDFKMVNDSHGHTLGDDLLVQVASRLRAVLRSNDVLGRLGGDEFLIVLDDIAEAADVVPTLRRIKAELAAPFVLAGSEIWVNCSMGIAVFPDDGGDARELMRHSDMAMYQAKEDQGSQFHFFARELGERMQARLKMETALRQALELDEFELAFQAKIEASSGKLAGCESLLRWRRDGRLIEAEEFVEVAEKAGLLVDLGCLVLNKACAQAKDWATRYGPISIAVNVSAQQLRERDFANFVINTAKRYDIPASSLELEITETVLIEELEHVIRKLLTLRDAGFIISIDDFGTGYSSLSYLTHLPANSLKIDKSFVSGPQASEIVLDMIIAMAQALGLTTVAEGVETREQRAKLVARGCDLLQGHLLGGPMCNTDFEKTFLNACA
jgi:diguanylate cyclase (GGDEF)-like protein